MAIASTEAFSGWSKTFSEPRLCAAIVDRLTVGGQIIETGSDSYRLARTARNHAAGTTAQSPAQQKPVITDTQQTLETVP